MIRVWCVVFALIFIGCEDKVRVTIKVKTKEADAAVDASQACCQAETATKSVVVP